MAMTVDQELEEAKALEQHVVEKKQNSIGHLIVDNNKGGQQSQPSSMTLL